MKTVSRVRSKPGAKVKARAKITEKKTSNPLGFGFFDLPSTYKKISARSKNKRVLIRDFNGAKINHKNENGVTTLQVKNTHVTGARIKTKNGLHALIIERENGKVKTLKVKKGNVIGVRKTFEAGKRKKAELIDMTFHEDPLLDLNTLTRDQERILTAIIENAPLKVKHLFGGTVPGHEEQLNRERKKEIQRLVKQVQTVMRKE